MKIQIKIDNNCLVFSKYNRKIEQENLNNTNVINEKNLKFSDEYILNNLDIISTFLNLIVIKNKITCTIIKNLEVSLLTLKLINNISQINEVIIEDDREINYTIASLLLDNNNITKVECYSMPEILFYRFKRNVVSTRHRLSVKSDFMIYNNINTYSDICNKEEIVIDSILEPNDVDDIIYFFRQCKSVKSVVIKGYNKENLISFLKIIKDSNLSNIKINIVEDNTNTQNILNDVKIFDKLGKEYNVTIRIKYSKEYKEKNSIKEVNIKMLKNCLLCIIVLSLFLLVSYKLLLFKSVESTKLNIEEINNSIQRFKSDEFEPQLEIVGNDASEEERYISSYYENYTNIYNELLNINDNTVGWLKVNNTKIDLPIVQYIDNNYYLNHAYDKSSNILGWAFVDYRNNLDVIDQNTIIYGHSMIKGGLIFTTLQNVLNESWYTNPNNLEIDFSIKGNMYKWKVFSIYTIDVTSDYLYTNFDSNYNFLTFVNKLKDRSIYNFSASIDENSKILTLSTCYKDDDHRLVVHAFRNF